MSKSITLLLVLVFMAASCLSTVELGWASSKVQGQTFGGLNNDSTAAMVQTNDDGYAILGTTEGEDWLVKIDAFGNMKWNQTIKFGDSNRLTSLIQTSDGGYALAGYRNSVTNNVVSSGAGLSDFWLVKTDEHGKTEWTKTYGGKGHDRAESLVETSDGGYALAGYTHMSFEQNGFWLVKTDKSGNIEWNQTYGGDVAHELVETSDGGFALAGTAWFGAGNCWLVKTDEYGKMQWSSVFGEEDEHADWVSSLIGTSDGGYALAGKSTTGYFSTVYSWLIKTDAYGKKEWMQKYTEGRFGALIETTDRGFAVAGDKLDGNESYDFWLIKTDASGIMEWNHTYGGEAFDSASSLVETSDGGFALAGVTESFGAGGTDLWLIKTDGYGIIPESPSLTSSPEPIQTNQNETIVDVAIAVAVIGAALGLLIYIIKKENSCT